LRSKGIDVDKLIMTGKKNLVAYTSGCRVNLEIHIDKNRGYRGGLLEIFNLLEKTRIFSRIHDNTLRVKVDDWGLYENAVTEASKQAENEEPVTPADRPQAPASPANKKPRGIVLASVFWIYGDPPKQVNLYIPIWKEPGDTRISNDFGDNLDDNFDFNFDEKFEKLIYGRDYTANFDTQEEITQALLDYKRVKAELDGYSKKTGPILEILWGSGPICEPESSVYKVKK